MAGGQFAAFTQKTRTRVKNDCETHEKNSGAYFFFGVNHHFCGKFSCRRKQRQGISNSFYP
jgi:hypothetical protein